MSSDFADWDKEEEWRAKAREGALTVEDMKEIVAYRRQGRIGASYAAKTTKTKTTRTKAEKASAMSEDLLADLDDFLESKEKQTDGI